MLISVNDCIAVQKTMWNNVVYDADFLNWLVKNDFIKGEVETKVNLEDLLEVYAIWHKE